MELIKMECPYCGGPLEVDRTKKEFFCIHCGKKLMATDMQSTNAFGQPVADEQLVEMLEAVGPLMTENQQLKASVEKKEAEIKEYQAEINSVLMHENETLYQTDKDHYKKVLIALGAAIFLFVLSIIPHMHGLFVVSIPAVIVAGYVLFGNIKIIESTEAIERKQGELDGLRTALAKNEKELNKYNTDVIPAKYRTGSCIKFFKEVLSDQRATTMQQAINLYETEKRERKRDEMQAQQLKQIEALNKENARIRQQLEAQNRAMQAQNRR